MQWWLNVFFLVNGLWLPGTELAGWGPRPYATEAECQERKAFAEKACREHPLAADALWICSAGEPLSELPPILRGRPC